MQDPIAAHPYAARCSQAFSAASLYGPLHACTVRPFRTQLELQRLARMRALSGPVSRQPSLERLAHVRACCAQVVYILDQVRALEREMLKRIAAQGLAIVPRILVITRLIPDAEARRLLFGAWLYACVHACMRARGGCASLLAHRDRWLPLCGVIMQSRRDGHPWCIVSVLRGRAFMLKCASCRLLGNL